MAAGYKGGKLGSSDVQMEGECANVKVTDLTLLLNAASLVVRGAFV